MLPYPQRLDAKKSPSQKRGLKSKSFRRLPVECTKTQPAIRRNFLGASTISIAKAPVWKPLPRAAVRQPMSTAQQQLPATTGLTSAPSNERRIRSAIPSKRTPTSILRLLVKLAADSTSFRGANCTVCSAPALLPIASCFPASANRAKKFAKRCARAFVSSTWNPKPN